jgi:hypothetical protein
MARDLPNPDIGKYNRPAQIQAPGAYVDNGEGGNANANVWTTVRGGGPSPLMILLDSGNYGRGLRRSVQYGQLYPEANHWAEFLYASDVAIDATLTLLVDNRRFQILGAVDHSLAHQITLLALVETQAQGSK